MPLPFHSAPTAGPLSLTGQAAVAAAFAASAGRPREIAAVVVPLLTGVVVALVVSMDLEGLSSLSLPILMTAVAAVLMPAWMHALAMVPDDPVVVVGPVTSRALRRVTGTVRSVGRVNRRTRHSLALDGTVMMFPRHWPRVAGPVQALVFVCAARGNTRSLGPPYVVRVEENDGVVRVEENDGRTHSLEQDLASGRITPSACRFHRRA